MSLKSWLKHAFAVDTDTAPPTEEELLLVERLCQEVVRRHMTLPAVTLLQSARPLNYLGSQLMQFFLPFVSAVTNADEYAIMAKFLERRDSVDILCDTLERLDGQAEQRKKDNTASASEESA